MPPFKFLSLLDVAHDVAEGTWGHSILQINFLDNNFSSFLQVSSLQAAILWQFSGVGIIMIFPTLHCCRGLSVLIATKPNLYLLLFEIHCRLNLKTLSHHNDLCICRYIIEQPTSPREGHYGYTTGWLR